MLRCDELDAVVTKHGLDAVSRDVVVRLAKEGVKRETRGGGRYLIGFGGRPWGSASADSFPKGGS